MFQCFNRVCVNVHDIMGTVTSSTTLSRILILGLIIWPNLNILLTDRKADYNALRGNLSISAPLRCVNKTNARNVNLFAAHLRSANQGVV